MKVEELRNKSQKVTQARRRSPQPKRYSIFTIRRFVMKTSKSLLKQRTPWFVTGLVSMSLMLFAISGCERPAEINTNQGGTSQNSPTPCPSSQSPKDQLLEASKAAGVNIHADEVFSVSRGSESFIGAPIAGWETIPATALPNGVDFGFAYFSTEEPRVPAGYYRLKGFADVRAVGTVKGRVQLLDRSNKVAAELPAEIQVHSMTVPAEASSQRSFLTAITTGDRHRIWFRCPNGECIIIDVLLPRTFAIH